MLRFALLLAMAGALAAAPASAEDGAAAALAAGEASQRADGESEARSESPPVPLVIGAMNRLEQDRGVHRGTRHLAHVVARVAERDHAVQRHAAEGRLDGGETLGGAGTDDRAAGLRAEPAHREPRGHGRAGPRGRSARAVSGSIYDNHGTQRTDREVAGDDGHTSKSAWIAN